MYFVSFFFLIECHHVVIGHKYALCILLIITIFHYFHLSCVIYLFVCLFVYLFVWLFVYFVYFFWFRLLLAVSLKQFCTCKAIKL